MKYQLDLLIFAIIVLLFAWSKMEVFQLCGMIICERDFVY